MLRWSGVAAQSPLYGDKTLPAGDDFGRHRRLIYRSKQRGWLELDLLLGEFALLNLPDYDHDRLDLWEEILHVSGHDIAGIWVAFFQECQQCRRGQVENPELYKYGSLL